MVVLRNNIDAFVAPNVFWLAVTLIIVSVYSLEPANAESAIESPHVPHVIVASGLPNSVRIHPDVVSGGKPDGLTGFRSLRKLGVTTVISVDGVKPEISLARQVGIKYVHLPHGYDGISKQRAMELTRAVRVLPKPIYIHCHHGKHRSPAAGAIACIQAGLISHVDGLRVLQIAGTGDEYVGLHQAVRQARLVDAEVVDAMVIEFQESVEMPPIVDVMSQLAETIERVSQKNNETRPSAGFASRSHEVLLLQELFAEFQRDPAISGKPPEFRKLIKSSQREVSRLRKLVSNNGDSTKPSTNLASPASTSLLKLKAICTSCHRQFRN